MSHVGCHQRGRDIAKDEGLRLVQYGVVKDEIVYLPEPRHVVEKVSIADRARVTHPVGERLGSQGWLQLLRKKMPQLRWKRQSNGGRDGDGAV